MCYSNGVGYIFYKYNYNWNLPAGLCKMLIKYFFPEVKMKIGQEKI